MDVARIERLMPESGAVVNDQVHVLGVAELKPGARKIEWRPWNFVDRKDLVVKLSRPLDIGDGDRNVVNGRNFHRKSYRGSA
jgi:hypothetical protein